jgi:hypothetical protein
MQQQNKYCNIGVGTMGAPWAGAPPPMFLNCDIARLNFIHTDHTALAYRSIFPLSNHLPTPLYN